MKTRHTTLRIYIFSLLVYLPASVFGQVHVLLDHWYNHETSKKTGQPFHYLWTDTLNSGFSQLGEIFVSKGGVLSMLEQPANAKDLSRADIYIIVDPDTTSENPSPNYISDKSAKAIAKWVKRGGVLLLMANDGPNSEFTHLNRLAGRFGIHFNPVTLNPVTNRNWEMGAITSFPDNPLFKGLHKIYMKEVSSITVSGGATSVLEDSKGNTIMAQCSYGKGFVLAVGDPWLYNEYIGYKYLPKGFQNHRAAENLVDYLYKRSP